MDSPKWEINLLPLYPSVLFQMISKLCLRQKNKADLITMFRKVICGYCCIPLTGSKYIRKPTEFLRELYCQDNHEPILNNPLTLQTALRTPNLYPKEVNCQWYTVCNEITENSTYFRQGLLQRKMTRKILGRKVRPEASIPPETFLQFHGKILLMPAQGSKTFQISNSCVFPIFCTFCA